MVCARKGSLDLDQTLAKNVAMNGLRDNVTTRLKPADGWSLKESRLCWAL